MKHIKINPFPIYFLSFPLRSLWLIGAFCFLIFCSVGHLYSEPLIELTAQQQFAFADSLFEKKDFMSATLEFKKFVFFFPKDDRVEQAQFKIGMSMFYQKDYENALNQFASVLDQYGPTETGIQSGLFISRSYIALMDFDSAVNNLLFLLEQTDDEEIHDKIYFQLGWTYIESCDFQKAKLSFEKIKDKTQPKYPIESIIHDMDEYKKNSAKDPLLAGSLSIIPGGGYLYCGRYKDALISLIINSACAAAAYESFDKDLNVLGGIITVIGIGFYGGNIYGGVSSAYKHNKTTTNDFISHLKNQFNIDLMAGIDADSVSIKVRRKF